MTPKDRLKQYLKLKHLSMSAFAARCELDKSVVSRLGETTSEATWSKIAANSDVNVDWLINGQGNMLKPESTARMLGGVYASIQGDNDVVMVDYIPGTATATFTEYGGTDDSEFERIPVLKQYGEILDNSYKVFEVIGESMSPRIPNRAKILTRQISKSKWGRVEGVVVVVFADEVVVKRIIGNDLDTDNSLSLYSDNPMYGECKVALADIRHIFKAVRIISADIL